MQTPGELDAGRHDAVVVDARWDKATDPHVLELSLTLLTGAVKGEVVEIGFTAGSAALGRALAALGLDMNAVTPGDTDLVTAGALGMPCTLVLARDRDGALGYALEP